jgi:inhibitor of KinA
VTAVAPVGPAVAFEPAGDRALVLRVAREIAPEAHARVLAATAAVDRARPAWVVDVVPAYASLLVEYDAAIVGAREAAAVLGAIVDQDAAGATAPSERAPRLVEVPVWYDPSVAPDLEPLAVEKGITPAALAAWHSAAQYHVYALGFRPGFPFMGVVDPRLAAPRLAAPRARVAAGSVGIAGRQTGIYPREGPGGWRILGRTPLAVFDEARLDPFLLHVGDSVRFVAVDEARFRAMDSGGAGAG